MGHDPQLYRGAVIVSVLPVEKQPASVISCASIECMPSVDNLRGSIISSIHVSVFFELTRKV